MRYTIEVQHYSDTNLDGLWYPLSQTNDAAGAISEYLKFTESYSRLVRIRDAKWVMPKGNNHAL